MFPTELDNAKVLYYTPQDDYGAEHTKQNEKCRENNYPVVFFDNILICFPSHETPP